ncbi:MAG: sigma factor [Fodinibius sp.]|nr:sigma factor [Fodinibius sp.]
MDTKAEIFESHRPSLFRLAYSMLGRVASAKDAVQEAFIRWQKQDFDNIRSHKAYLASIVNRICLDEIKSGPETNESSTLAPICPNHC